MSTIATMESLRRFADVSDALIYSPLTGEEYSANPGDYFWQAEGEPLRDREGEPMILVRKRVVIDELS